MKRFIKADSGKFGSENQIKFFYKGKFLGSCDAGDAWCPELLNLMKSDKEVATSILNYMNSLGDPVFPVSEEDWGTPETNVDNVDIEDLYNTFLQELDFEYRDSETMGFGFYVGGDYLLPDFEIFDGPTVDDVESSTKIKASRYDNVPGYKAPEGGYLYIFKHGIGPGTLPSDVEIIKTKDLPSGYTAVWLRDFLTTDELKKYDIPSETRINELLGRIGYCQKNGDVVPCDDVEACGDIKASTRYMANMVSASDDGADESGKGMKFNSADEIYIEIVDNNHDLYFPESGVYMFEYNEVGSIAYYYLSKPELLQLAKEVGPGNYIAGALGPGGNIIDPCMLLPNGDVVEYDDSNWDSAYRDEDAVIDYSPITEFLERFVGEECISAMPEDLL